ncbi:hypothetical protein BH23GEM11_BH23GEM11_20730 [soil metagenome]
MNWLVDAHVHYHPDFGWARFLNGALENTARISASTPFAETLSATCLLLADPAGVDSLRDLLAASDDALPPGWRLQVLEGGAVSLTPAEPGPPLLLVPGRQVRTRERLELLALDSTLRIPDGLSLEETAEAAREGGAISILPWGFGKWWLARGRVISDMLDTARELGLHVGDNGNRPGGSPRPRLLARARREGILDLPGSDPLPFPGHARRAASFGFLVPGDPDRSRPGSVVRAGLASFAETGESPPSVEAGRRGALAFAGDQLRMQLHRVSP